MKITLKDGSVKEYSEAKSVYDIAADISSGLARVDFFVEKDTERVIFNELNTLPGFTPISMYSMLWNACGKPMNVLLDELIDLALERFGVK